MRALLRADGCTVRISGAREQWTYPASRRAIVIISADKGVLRLCAERIGDYAAKVPVSLRHTIVRAPNCGGDCRPWDWKKCEYVKCRYNAFMFSMIKDKLCDVRDMLQMELDSRRH